jgi:hypothetical protein
MGQGKGGAATSRKADNAGKEEHKCFQTESAGHILCMSYLLSVQPLCRNKKMLAWLLCWTLLRLVGKMDLKLIGIRNHTCICPNCSGPSVNVTSTDPEVTLGSCASSL